MSETFTPAELDALERGLATIYRGRVIPVIRGGDGTDDDSDDDDAGAHGGAGGGSQADDDDAHGGDDDGDGDETLSLDEARKLRRENANLRKRAKDAEGKLSKRERADLSEQERLKKDRDDAANKAAKLEAANRRLRGSAIATRLGAIDGEAVVAHPRFDWDAIDDPDDDTQVERAIKAFKAQRPALFSDNGGDGRRREGADGGAGRGNGGSSRADTNVRPGIGRLRHAYDNATK